LCRRVSFHDACFARTQLQYYYLTLNAIDGDNHILPVAISIIRGETKANCKELYSHLKRAPYGPFVDWLNHHEHAAFADRGKEGLAIEEELPTMSLM
jgi:hypothetical protein